MKLGQNGSKRRVKGNSPPGGRVGVVVLFRRLVFSGLRRQCPHLSFRTAQTGHRDTSLGDGPPPTRTGEWDH